MTEHELLQLNIANAALGIVTLLFVLMVGWAAFKEIAARVRARVSAAADQHSFMIQGLGVTMADGGERVDEKTGEKEKKS